MHESAWCHSVDEAAEPIATASAKLAGGKKWFRYDAPRQAVVQAAAEDSESSDSSICSVENLDQSQASEGTGS